MNLPKDFETRMKNMLGSEYEDFKKSFLSEQTSHAMRINPEKENTADLIFKEFGDLEKVSWCENGFYVDKSAISGLHPYHMAGLFYFQEASAMCAVSALPINEGDFVQKGDVIGKSGNTGNSTGPHLHLEILENGLLVDPELYLE